MIFRNVELTRISMCLAKSGVKDEWGNTYSDNWDKQSGTDANGGSYWYQRCIKYSFYNRGYTISSGFDNWEDAVADEQTTN